MSESFTVVITGDSGTGKTSLLYRIKTKTFVENHKVTVAGELVTHEVNVEGKKISISFWDTTGTEDYESMNKCHYFDAQGVIYFYSVDNSDSLDRISSHWKAIVEESSKVPHLNFLVGNKIDLNPSEVVVSPQTEDPIAESIGSKVYHTSALNGTGVFEFVEDLAKILNAEFGTKTETPSPIETKESQNCKCEIQ